MNGDANLAYGLPRIVGKAAALALLFALCCWWSIMFTRGPGGVSTLWVASGVLCGILLRSPRSQWPLLIAAAFVTSIAVNMWWRGTWSIAIGLSVANIIDAGLVAFMLVHFVGDVADAARIKLTSAVAVVSTLSASAFSGVVAAAVLASFGAFSFPAVFRSWFASHALGMVIFATLTLVAQVEGRRLFGRRGRRTELALMIGLIALSCLAIFSQSRYPLLFLLHPVLLLAVFRHRFSGFVLGIFVIAFIATTATAGGNGPFMLIPDTTGVERTLVFQLFLASICLLALPVAVVLTERAVLTRRLADREHQYRMLADYSRDLVIRFDSNGVRRYISPSVTEMLGWSREDLVNPRWDIVHPDDIGALLKVLSDLRTQGGAITVQYRVRHKQGHYITIEAHARLVPGPNPGAPPDIIYSGRDVTRRVEAEKALEETSAACARSPTICRLS